MKINPIHSMKTNPYKKAAENQPEKPQTQHKDKLEISAQAKELLKKSELQSEREKKVNEIKKQYDAGNYEINYKKTAERLLDFWKK
ncbi:flagellar biosynthesis anti-sigma factor FlgM [Pueribacillus theae]|uniref:Negative regulator of flagellin synthesis n=1 Tax=Pueribacillus theae TaxID=2171751 RepID=A0A2U1K634_9BACI|nr:flagellar biosynthesis anti-sigma factor FlgM [Pueribacillus theae]PWA12629.1 flagellar biosynthesis anti-sigma factor FlgM [Pueribacillus theae]